MVQLVGIVNLTEDSFSDGGRFVGFRQAIAHGERLIEDGANWLDLGAESSNPQGKKVEDHVEIERLTPVIRHFKSSGTKISVDTCKPSVVKAVLDLGADMINDVSGLQQPASVEALLAHPQAMAVLMHSRNAGPRAETIDRPHRDLIPEIIGFFRRRIGDLEGLGLGRERIILDPGMGYFLGGNPQPSLYVLRHLEDLLVLGRPVYVSTSRKSFIGTVLGKEPAERGAGTLATELWAIEHGATFIRTHDVAPLAQAYRLRRAISDIV
jgi:dihydropteroate synthase